MRRAALVLVVAGSIVVAVVAQRGPAANTEWRYYGGDAASTRYSPLDQINRANVNSLQVAWRWSSPDNEIAKANPASGRARYQDTPLMVNGVLYTETVARHVRRDRAGHAARRCGNTTRKSGRAGGRRTSASPIAASAYWTDGTTRRIISGTHDAHLVSIDAETGKPDLAFGDNGRVDVIAGLPYAERDPQLRHQLHAGRGQERHHRRREHQRRPVRQGGAARRHQRLRRRAPARSCGRSTRCRRPASSATRRGKTDRPTYTGNTNVWSMITVDEALGYVYLPFGTPTNDYYGGHRHGNNLFAESLVCLDATTGKRVWHFQAVHHGLWDYDFPAAPVLVRHHGRRQAHQRRRAGQQAGISSTSSIARPARRSGRSKSGRCRSRRRPARRRRRRSRSRPGRRRSNARACSTSDVIDFTPELQGAGARDLKQFDHGPLFTPPSLKGAIQLPGNAGGARLGRRGVRSGDRDVVSCRRSRARSSISS